MAQDIPSFFSTRDVPRLDVVRKKKSMLSEKSKRTILLSVAVVLAIVLWVVEPPGSPLLLMLISAGCFVVAHRTNRSATPKNQRSVADLMPHLLIEMAADTKGRTLLEEGDRIRLALKAFDDAYRLISTGDAYALQDSTTMIIRRCADVPGMRRSMSQFRRGLRHKSLVHPDNVHVFKRLRLSMNVLARSLGRRQDMYLDALKKKHARDARRNRHVR
ncbi:hypothetical protein HOI18_05340 [Candidatus Uhrbacteria bacterium]|jgi:hypothetical protein|nr:hypothetical protein [Candidatus Uhrbacteria bacterium]